MADTPADHMARDVGAASHPGPTRLGRELGGEGGDDAMPDVGTARRPAAAASEFCSCKGGKKDKACGNGNCKCWKAGWACSPEHCGCKCCTNPEQLDSVVEGLPRVPASDSWLHVHRLFKSLIALVDPINVTIGEAASTVQGLDRPLRRPASSGETPPAGQDGQEPMAMDATAAPVVRRALTDSLMQLETAMAASAQGRCTLYNYYYLAYEKGMAGNMHGHLYCYHRLEGLLRAELINLPKAIKALEPSAWRVNKPTALRLLQHTDQTMRGLREVERPLLPILPTRRQAQDNQAALKAAINGWLQPSPRRKYGSVRLDHVLAAFQAEFTAKTARSAAPAEAQNPPACRPPFWTQVTRARDYNNFAIWNPNTRLDVRVCLKQLPCILEQEQNDVTALRLKGRGLSVRIPPQTLVTITNIRLFSNSGGGLQKTRGGWSVHATTSYRQHKGGDTIAPAGTSGSAGAAVGVEGAAPPPAPAAPAKPVRTQAEWEAALPNLGFIGRHIAQPPPPPKQVNVTEGGLYDRGRVCGRGAGV